LGPLPSAEWALVGTIEEMCGLIQGQDFGTKKVDKGLILKSLGEKAS
jgi:hypothetical protein